MWLHQKLLRHWRNSVGYKHITNISHAKWNLVNLGNIKYKINNCFFSFINQQLNDDTRMYIRGMTDYQTSLVSLEEVEQTFALTLNPRQHSAYAFCTAAVIRLLRACWWKHSTRGKRKESGMHFHNSAYSRGFLVSNRTERTLSRTQYSIIGKQSEVWK